ncbi:iron complex transport system substrate-binding protein [Vogesella indigofera]|uniref:Iron complex transport system substrate-binding protein n=1 Tax=Vogesella indigofera TaxID=45465 RepID=A0A495BK34_VOGIN|nr:cobalamin-binding protein [Vogesella indigofera]RKQ60952.1 iron complex transport system substrate-binding protein [Vogesella indigofera]
MKRLLPLLACLPALAAPVSVIDDQGSRVSLPAPAQRVISLAPHVTELAFAAGGGARLIAVDDNSDYPAAAKALPKAGSFRAIDLERIVAAKPDLLLVWLHGPSARQLEPLRQLGIPLFYSQPKRFADIPSNLRRIGQLLGSSAQAEQAARRFEQDLAVLRQQQQGKSKLSVFYQVWDKPLYTLNGQHIVSDAIALCGGRNVFASLPVTAPVVTDEAVIAANPQVILSAAMRHNDDLLKRWQRMPGIAAVQNRQLHQVNGDLLNRPTPRMIDGTRQLCAKLDLARR